MDRLTEPPARPAALVPATAARRVFRWAWLIVLVVGLTLFELIRWAVQNTGNLNPVPTLLLLGAVVEPLAFATFPYGRQATFEVSGLALVVMAVVGGVVGVIASGLLEYHTLRRLGPWSTIGIDWLRVSPPDFGEQLREGSALFVASSRGLQTR